MTNKLIFALSIMSIPALASDHLPTDLLSSTGVTRTTITTPVQKSLEEAIMVGLSTPEEDREKVIHRRNSTTTYTHTITCPAVKASMKTQEVTPEELELMNELGLKHKESLLVIQELDYSDTHH